VCGPNGCAATCPGTLTACNGGCVDLSTNADNCGSCGHKCNAPADGVATCAAKVCDFKCVAGYHGCSGQCVPESPSSCGASCTACPRPSNATATCNGGACGFTCNESFQPCNGGTACCPIGAGDAGTGCDGSTTCDAPRTMGSVRGDIGNDSVTMRGSTSQWLSITVAEGSSSFPLVDLRFTATLTSPPGMDFNLFVYQSPCGSGSYGQSTNGAGQTDTVSSGWADLLGSDESRVVMIEVRHVGGGTCGASWTLAVDGNR
jgi:hypothetical protein